MTHASRGLEADLETLPRMPPWVSAKQPEAPDIVAFRSGAALVVLDQLMSNPAHGMPLELLANRLALTAATATSKLEGRLSREADIRDAFHLTPPGAARGPDGALLAFWRAAARIDPGRPDGRRRIEALIGPDLAASSVDLLRAGGAQTAKRGPLAGCATVLCAVLEADNRAERAACLLADVTLALAMGWSRIRPVTARHLTTSVLRDLVADRQGAGSEVQAHILASVEGTIRSAQDLIRRAAALRSVAPKLRAKGSGAAVEVFLTEDAVAPASMLSPMIRGTTTNMSARAARRFCDRLVELGVAHELTGRSTFRLYGIAS